MSNNTHPKKSKKRLFTPITFAAILYATLRLACGGLRVQLSCFDELALFIVAFILAFSIVPGYNFLLGLLASSDSWRTLQGKSSEERDFDFAGNFLDTAKNILLIISLLISGITVFFSPSFNNFLSQQEITINGTVTSNQDGVPDVDGAYVIAEFYDERERPITALDKKNKLRRFIPVNNGFYSLNTTIPREATGAKLIFSKKDYKNPGGENTKVDIFKTSIYHEFNVEKVPEKYEIVVSENNRLTTKNTDIHFQTGDKIEVTIINNEIYLDKKSKSQKIN